MIIIAGLGNPGKEYEKTRHNIGFLVLDEFAEKNNFPGFETKKFLNAAVSEKILDNENYSSISIKTCRLSIFQISSSHF